MHKRSIAIVFTTSVLLAVLCYLYGLWLFYAPPTDWMTAVTVSLCAIPIAWAVVRLIPHLLSFLSGEDEPHLAQSGARTYRRCGTRELFKLVLLVMALRLIEMAVGYLIHFHVYGYTDTFFQVQKMWLSNGALLFGRARGFYMQVLLWMFCYFSGACAAAALYYLILVDFNRSTARRAVRYLFFLPAACMLMKTSMQPVFLLCSVLCLLFMRKRYFPIANLFAMLAAIAHPFGCLLFVPICVEFVQVLIANAHAHKEMGKGYVGKQVGNGISFLLIPAGVGIVLLYSLLRYGDFTHIYAAYGYALSNPFTTVATFLHRFVASPFALGGFLANVLFPLLYLFGVAAVTVLAVGRIRTSYVLYLLLFFLAALCTGDLCKLPGLLTMCAVLPVTMASLTKRRWVDVLLLIGCGVLWFVYLGLFISGTMGTPL